MKNIYIYSAVAILAIVGIIATLNFWTGGSTGGFGHNMVSGGGDHMGGSGSYDKKLPNKSPADRAPLTFTEKNGVKEFRLTAEAINWEYVKGKTVVAWGYNGQIPGPEIRVTEGDKVKFVFTNNLPKATTVHWHGVDVPNNQDGVPGVTQEAIKPGETYTYEFTAKPAGTRFYHTHGGAAMVDEAEQLDMGLSGAFIIEPKNYAVSKPDKEYTLILDEWQTVPMKASRKTSFLINQALANGDEDQHEEMNNMMNMSTMVGEGHTMDYNLFTINGRAFPDSEPLTVKKGERVRIRMINGGTSTIHPMHLHGHQFKVVAVDGNPVPLVAQLTRNTQPIHPGETYDIEFIADNPGTWLFHCHELHHADGGMIVPVVYE